MLISHLDFLVFEPRVRVFPFLCYLSILIDFMSFGFILNNNPSSVIKIVEKNLVGCLRFFIFFKMFDEKKFFSGVEFNKSFPL